MGRKGEREEKGYTTWAFLFKIWENMKFGENFIKQVRLFYTSEKAEIIVNGDRRKLCEIQKGTRQSPLLFTLVLEIDITQGKIILELKIKRETGNLRPLTDDNVDFV